MSFLQNIEESLSHVWTKLTGKVAEDVKAAETAAILLYKDLLASTVAHGPQYVQVLKDAAKAAVDAASSLPASGGEKALAAAASVVSVLTTEGLPIIRNDIEGAVRAAYASFKANVA